METLHWLEGTQNQAFCLRPSNSTIQNNSSFQYRPGGWSNGNPSIEVSQAQPANLSANSGQYLSPNGKFTNRNYWNSQALDLNLGQNLHSFSAQRYDNGTREPRPQASIGSQALKNGNCTASLEHLVPTSQYPSEIPLIPVFPKRHQAPNLSLMTNRVNPQMTHMTAENRNCSNSQKAFQCPGAGNGAQATSSQSQGNCWAKQHYFERTMHSGQGAVVKTSAQLSHPVRQNSNAHYIQGTAVIGQGGVNGENMSMRTNQTKKGNAIHTVGFSPAGDRTIVRQAMAYRRNDIRPNPSCSTSAALIQTVNPSSSQGMVNGGLGPAISSSTTTACSPRGQSTHPQAIGLRNVTEQSTACPVSGEALDRILWDLALYSQMGSTRRSNSGSERATMVQEPRAIETQCGSAAPAGNLRSSLNPPFHRENGSANISRVGEVSSESENSVRSVTVQRPYCRFPSSGPAGNMATDLSCTGMQGSQSLPTGQEQPRRTSVPVRGNIQGTGYQVQSHSGSMQPSSFPRTLNRCLMEGVRHTDPTKMGEHAPKQVSVSGVDNRNTICSQVMNSSHGQTSPNQGGQPLVSRHSEQPTGGCPPYPQRHGFFVTVTEDRPGTGFTAENVIFMGNQPPNHASALHECLQMSSSEKTPESDRGETLGELSASNDPRKHNTQLSGALSSSTESMFNLTKAGKQQNKSICSSSQKAVAVVPPISQQSSNSSDITNASDELPFKIQSVWSLTKDDTELASQHRMGEATNVGSAENVDQTGVSTPPPVVNPDSKGMTERTPVSLQMTPQALDSLGLAKKDVHNSEKPDLEPQMILTTSQTEEAPSSHLNVHKSVTVPRVKTAESGGRNGGKDRFDLSSVPVNKWTAARLCKLVSFLEKRETPPKLEMDIDKVLSLYWGGSDHNFEDVFQSDIYRSIMNDVSVFAKDTESIIFSQVLPTCRQKVAENCLIIKHDTTFPADVVYKSSWLNLNDQLDDIDREHGFPFHLRFGQRVLQEDCERKEPNRCDKSKPDETASKSPSPVPPTQPQIETVAPIGEDAACPRDPLSSLEISVLTHEEALRFFRGEESRDEKAEDLSNPVHEATVIGEETTWADRPLKKKCQIEVFCCIDRWIDAVTGNGQGSLCSCKSQATSRQEPQEGNAGVTDRARVEDIVAKPKASTHGGDNPALETKANPMQSVKIATPDLCGEKEVEAVMCDKSTETDHRPVVRSTWDTVKRAEKKNVLSCSKRNADDCLKGSIKNSGKEKLSELETPPVAVRGASNVVEIEIKDVCSTYEEVRKIATAAFEPLWNKHKHEGSPPETVDESPSSGSKIVPSVSNKPVPESGVAIQRSEALNVKDKETTIKKIPSMTLQRVQESVGKHHRRVERVERREKKRVRWEKVLDSGSPMQDHSIPSLSEKKGREKLLPRDTVHNVNMTKADTSKTCLQKKRKADHRSESPKSKVQKLGKGEHSEKSQSNSSESRHVTEGKPYEALPKIVEETSSVSLALYGSSPQKRNGTLGLNRHSHSSPYKGRPYKSRPYADKMTPPPATITFNVNSNVRNTSENYAGKGSAKQQVFAKWKSSLVQTKTHSMYKFHSSKRHSTKEWSELSKDQATACPSQRQVKPIKLRKMTVYLDNNENQKGSVHKPDKNLTPAHAQHKSKREKREGKRKKKGKWHDSAALSAFLMEKEKSWKKGKPLQRGEPPRHRSQPPSISGQSAGKAKTDCKTGTPAPIRPQEDDRVLNFNLLPRSFNFSDGKGHRDSVKQSSQVKEPERMKMSSKQSDSLKKDAWRVQGSWSKSSEGKSLTSSKVMSPSAKTPSALSDLTFQEYKKKYMAKGKK